MPAERSVKCLLLRAYLIANLFLISNVCASYIANIPLVTRPETTIFNASLGSTEWLYNIQGSLTSKQAQHLTKVDSKSGVLKLHKGIEDCHFLHENPFTVFIEARQRTRNGEPISSNQLYTVIPVSVYVHGENCKLKHRKKKLSKDDEKRRKELEKQEENKMVLGVGPHQRLWADFTVGSCWEPKQSILTLNNFVPSSARQCISSFSMKNNSIELGVTDSSTGAIGFSNLFCFNKPDEQMVILTLQLDPICSQGSYRLQDEDYNGNIPIQIRFRVENPPKILNVKDEGAITQDKSTMESKKRVRRGSRTVNRSPSFPQGQYLVNVPEEEEAGYIVETVAATDPDPSSSPSGALTYTMTAERDARSRSMFNINSETGLVTTSQRLDRETISEHLLKVTVTDHGTPPRSSYAYLQITVQDINDHAPEFEVSEYAISIEENQNSGTTVTEVYATDDDDGLNSDIRYSILNSAAPNDVFAINSRSGSITTRTRLDREKLSQYTLIINAVDLGTNPGQLNSTTRIVIAVEDINDNYPQFSKRNYEVGISEDSSPNRVIESIIATDADSGENAQLRYSMVGGNSQGHFNIDAYNGEIMLLSNLDYESTNNYRLVVRAQDGGRPSKSNTTYVIVTVIDVNDNAPRFPTNLYPVSVREDVRLGSPIALLTAFDADGGEFKRLTYSIVMQPDHADTFPFEIEEDSGQLTNSLLLDRELQDTYDFHVLASDQGVPPKTASTEVRVILIDVNDNAPIFSQSEYYGKVDEDAPQGTSVIDLKAVDPDIGNSVSYQITNGNVRNRFSIISQFGRGTISVALPLDYKQEPRFVLTVTASDNHYSSSCLVHVNITDTNTYRPVFDQSPYNAFISESVSVGHMVVQVHATDGDSGENARITYTMDNLAEFEINPDTGEIFSTLPLDRETKPSYTIHVTATDNGLEPQLDTTEVEIFLTDVNDNIPVFTQDHYYAEVSESVNTATSVIQIRADDEDDGANSQISYTFSNGHDGNGVFIIDESSGVIRTAQRLDREQKETYQLVAYALDGGRPMQETSVDITITILDENDNPPVFPKDEIDVYVEENRGRGEPVSTITAHDPDDGYNAMVHYSLVDGDMDLFEIDSMTGTLITLLEFDYEERSEYYVKVRATSVIFFNDAIVYIHILDQNDNSPVLNNFDIYFNNYEGHFPDGDIGQVPAYDPDVSDSLTYSVKSANRMDHLMLNRTSGGIRLNPILEGTDIPQIIPFYVEVSDGLNLVTSLCTFHMTMVTDNMLHSSVTVQLEDINSEQFLSPKLHKFIDALSTIIPVERKWIYMFSIKDDIVHSGLPILNVTFTAQRPDGQYYSSQYLQERIYLERSQLSRVSEATVLPFGDNLCLNEICFDYDQCLSPLTFWSTSGFISTTLVIFRSIHPEVLYDCDCPLGFTGNFCTTEINFCYTEPCKNDGECVQKEGGYTCICPSGFTGVNCEIDYHDGRCTRDVCKNGAQCRNYLIEGFECHCKGPTSEFDGPFCEVRTRNFPAGSFLMFWSLNQRVRMNIALSFATKEQNGLIFYNGRFNQRHDFIALEIVNGQVQFTFSAGEERTQVQASIMGGVNDGEWHKVMVDYHELTATVILDDCNTAISLQHGRSTIANYTCTARATQRGKYRFLNLNGPFLVGGLPSLPDDFPIDNSDYVGCIRDVYIDHSLLDLASNIEDKETLPGCGHKEDFCASDPCFQGASCENEWGTYTCHCPAGTGGRNCQEVLSHILRFEGDGYVIFQNSQMLVTIPWMNRIMFRTRDRNGLLMYIKLVSSIFISIEIVNGHVQYRTSTIIIRLDDVRVDDGAWHDIQAEWKNNEIVISLDHGQYRKSATAINQIDQQQVSEVLTGGIPGGDDGDGISQGFKGCIQGMTIGSAELDSTTARKINYKYGCETVDACAEVSCPEQSACIDVWDDYACECLNGHYGEQCTAACDLGVCQHGSYCLAAQQSSVGYSCRCSDLYFGDHCETTIQACPANWWGHRICGPCECDKERGFDTDCNKTTGECYCMEHSYRPMVFEQDYNREVLSDTCYACDCYEIGSLSPDCDQQTGQCKCKRGVTGRRCDSCRDPYAEVTLRGCEVIYDACPRRYAGGIWWQRTKFAKTASAKCPEGTKGYAYRTCSYDDNWLSTDLFNCTSETFSALKAILSDLDSGMKLHPELSFSISYELYKAVQDTSKFYGNDINIGYKVLRKVLNHEVQQKGLNVTAANKRNFTRYIIESASSLLDPENVAHWRVIQRSSRGAEDLMDVLEKFGASIARTSDFTYPPEFAVITPHIIMHHDIIIRENFTSVAIPDYDEEIWGDQGITDATRVHIPGDVIQPRPFDPSFLSISTNVAVTSYIRFNSIYKLLPNRADKSVLTTDDFKGQSINSPVVSLTLFDELTEGSDMTTQLNKPITIEIKVFNKNMTNPQCLFWNFTLLGAKDGGWSSEGCELTGYNGSHTNCSCNHLTSFAVLMDDSPEMHRSRQVAIQVITYLGLILSILALILAFLTMLCITNLHSNLNSIHLNLVFVLIIAEITFLVGIDSEVDHACTVVAIVLHYTLLSAFGWMFVEGIHLYRMMIEIRNINRGGMTWYYIVAYGAPGLIVGLAVPLSEATYGHQVNAANEHFCWLSLEDMLIWSFAGPVLAVVLMNLVVFVMAIRVSLRASHKNPEFSTLRSGLRAAGILLPLLGITWVFGLLAVNQNSALFQYLFAIFNCLLGCSIFVFHCVLNLKVRKEWKRCWHRIIRKKVQFDDTATSQRSALSYSKSAEGTPNRFNIGMSTNSLGSSRSTTKTSMSNIYRPDGYIKNNVNVSVSTATTAPSNQVHDYAPSYYKPSKCTNLDDPDLTILANASNILDWDYDFTGSMRTVSFGNMEGDQYDRKSEKSRSSSSENSKKSKKNRESDSDSDVSVRRRNRESMSLASSHSSDDEVAEEKKRRPEEWKNTPNKVSLPDTVLHSTPKKPPSPPEYYTLQQRKINKYPDENYYAASDTESRRSLPRHKIIDSRFSTPEKDSFTGSHHGSERASTPSSVSGSHRNLVVSNRPDVLPLKGIMKTPKSSIQGSINGSTSSLTKIGTGLSSSQPKLVGSSLTLTRDRVVAVSAGSPQKENNSDGGSSNETSV